MPPLTILDTWGKLYSLAEPICTTRRKYRQVRKKKSCCSNKQDMYIYIFTKKFSNVFKMRELWRFSSFLLALSVRDISNCCFFTTNVESLLGSTEEDNRAYVSCLLYRMMIRSKECKQLLHLVMIYGKFPENKSITYFTTLSA